MSQLDFRKTTQIGLVAGLIALSVSAIGMVEIFSDRAIITGLLTLGQLLLFILPVLAGYLVTRMDDSPVNNAPAFMNGALAGLITSLPVIGLILLESLWGTIRDSLPNVSPALMGILTFDQDTLIGSIILIGVMVVLGLLGAGFHLMADRYQKPLLSGIVWTLGIGLFADTIANTAVIQLIPRSVLRVFFGTKGIETLSAVIIFVLATAFTAWWREKGTGQIKERREMMSDEQQARLRQITIGVLVLLVIFLPWILGVYLSEVLDIVGIFILMGLGLNIVVGFAGLLDLGYVAFFAIGAYTMGLLTATGDIGFGWPFWLALPISVIAAVLAGITLGIPVLRMRGDYLAIVTLGFGEIIRGLVVSDLLKPIIGGAQGIIKISRPVIPLLNVELVSQQAFYYLILIGCIAALFVSARLRDSRPGRRWMALREDEDVAEAMGIHLVNTKLLAFAIGAALGGLAGGIFAARLGSIFPHSFNLLISINVLVLIIVGGIGSLPGVVVGALVLVGLPELLREFSEYRLLIYGALLIAMMLLRPEGLWPSPIRRLELHAAKADAEGMGSQSEKAADMA